MEPYCECSFRSGSNKGSVPTEADRARPPVMGVVVVIIVMNCNEVE